MLQSETSAIKIGHSLGGALAELDALYLSVNLPASTSIKAMTFGTPRVGNAAFASLLDSKVRCARLPSFAVVDLVRFLLIDP